MGYEPIKQETKELYTKIWTHFAVGHFRYEQLASLFNCSVDTVSNAINWGSDNRVQLPSQVIMEAAKEAVENRIRELMNDLVRIKQETPVNWNAVIGTNKLIKENEELLWKLQGVIQDRSVVTINSTQVNQLVQARDEAIEGMSDEQ
ncbi:MAG: hypothetical protein A3J51_01165 [Omnitrophica WOR_2 bacterium RIFCSPHIGHO2_02_FULL_45_21]|nr:MAG: hypothetical protein A3J51_01165 [Omnitrophica WOR_2 bacterium RIFCSPHIGHO2_02_FULL_45_21]